MSRSHDSKATTSLGKAAALAVAEALASQTTVNLMESVADLPGVDLVLFGGDGSKAFLAAAAGAAARAAADELGGNPDADRMPASRAQKDRARTSADKKRLDPVEAACLWVALRSDKRCEVEACARAAARRALAKASEMEGTYDADEDARRSARVRDQWSSRPASTQLLGPPPSPAETARRFSMARIVQTLCESMAAWCGAAHPNAIAGFVAGIEAFEGRGQKGLRDLVRVTKWCDARLAARHLMTGSTRIARGPAPALGGGAAGGGGDAGGSGAAREPSKPTMGRALREPGVRLLERIPDPALVAAIMLDAIDTP